ncbi:MAG: helix-turn-helix transcriptional regulator [Cyanobacteria bacterium J06638_20]
MNVKPYTFPHLLKSWRAKSQVSQLELSLRCNVSQRHISFVELAKAVPSRSMVLDFCEALNIPLRDRNVLLLAAGYAPEYQESKLNEPELAAVDKALTMMLTQQEPFPAMVIDRMFNVVRANHSALNLQMMLFDVAQPNELPPIAGNLLRGLFHSGGYRDHIANWTEIAPYFLRRLRDEIFAHNNPQDLQELLQELQACDGVSEDWVTYQPGQWQAPILTIDIKKDDVELSLFSTIATLGIPLDITLQEIRIECYFPADEKTREYFMVQRKR